MGVSAAERYTQVASQVSKADARQLLRSGELNLTSEQTAKALKTLGSGRMDNESLKVMHSGELRISAERAGAVSGFQRMSFEINPAGETNKVVQTAFDDANVLVRQRPEQPKNNLYDVKKWTR